MKNQTINTEANDVQGMQVFFVLRLYTLAGGGGRGVKKHLQKAKHWTGFSRQQLVFYEIQLSFCTRVGSF